MYKHILAAVDGSPTSNRGLDEAIALAKDQKAELKLLHVIDESFLMYDMAGWSGNISDALLDGGSRLLADAVARAAEQGVRAQSGMVETMTARVADKILEQAADWKADLIVMGTHGRRGVSHLVMGSDAEAVLHGAAVPVLLVKANAAQDAGRQRESSAKAAA